MLRHIKALTVSEALAKGLQLISLHGEQVQTRNGGALRVPGIVVTESVMPLHRVLFSPIRDANPFFHLFEALWMLAGRNDVEFVARFVKRMRTYSDNGATLHGAYGHRWRNHFVIDQLRCIISMLREDPTTRRAVLTMWDPGVDLGIPGKDLPCNTQIYFSTSHAPIPAPGEGLHYNLDMTVCCRSNDMLWGAHGANAVHFSILLEYVAAAVGMNVGRMYQVSNDYHLYYDKVTEVERLNLELATMDYGCQKIDCMPCPLRPVDWKRLTWWDAFEEDLAAAMSLLSDQTENSIFQTPFFATVVGPMSRAWINWELKRYDSALESLRIYTNNDWCLAGHQWLSRRINNRLKKEPTP